MRWIVSTRPDGGVSVTWPGPDFKFFTNGGGVQIENWDGQIAEMTGRGVREDVAVRWLRGLCFGGCTDAEAYELMRDRDTKPEWTGKELWDWSDVPSDRWYRNAWKRSPNGGPIYVDLARARPVQFEYVCDAVECENRRRAKDIDLFDMPIEVDFMAIRERIRCASDEIELRNIWPGELCR